MSEVETYADVVRPDDIAHQWPDGRDVPQLIIDVCAYVKDKQWMSLGATRLVGDRMDDYWIENGADLWRDFGCFMRLPDGSRVAQWFRDGDSSEPPIVLIGSEGEQEILAPNIEAFLAGWALGHFNDSGDLIANNTPVGLPSDLIRGEDDEVDDGRPAFAQFLTKRLGRNASSAILPKPAGDAFKAFFGAWQADAVKSISDNPQYKELARLLDGYVPRGKNIWERASFAVNVIGKRIEIGSKGDPRLPLPEIEAAAITPLVLAARQARSRGVHAPRGLWHHADILLFADGSCHINADWTAPPKFWRGAAATAKELALDLAEAPRSERWMEPWMRNLA